MQPKKPRRNLLFFIIGAVVICVAIVAGGAIWLSNDPQVQADVSATGTADALAAANSSATATAEFSAINSRLANKQLVFSESFDKADPFTSQTFNDAFKGGLKDSAYQTEVYISTGDSNLYRIIPLGKDLNDFVAEVDCTSSDPDGYCGIAYDVNPSGSTNPKSYYVSAVGDSNECDFESVLPSGFSTNNRGNCSANVQPNHLRVERFGNHLRFYVNDQLVDERELKDNMNSGDVGLFVGAYTPDSFSKTIYLKADNFQVWQVP